jgi:hypothetical protein
MNEEHNKYEAEWSGRGEMPSACKQQSQEVLISFFFFFFFYSAVVLNQNSQDSDSLRKFLQNTV